MVKGKPKRGRPIAIKATPAPYVPPVIEVGVKPFPQELATLLPGGAGMVRARENWYLGISADQFGVTARPGPPRQDQIKPAGNWTTWLVLGGRGSGKTRLGAEALLDHAMENPGHRLAVVAPTIGDCRSICFEGESGILACLPESIHDAFNRSLLELKLPNGSFIQGFGADEPRRLRGPQFHFGWTDEIASWRSKKVEGKVENAWDMLMMGMRLLAKDDTAAPPQVVATTTPKPVKLITDLVKDQYTHLTRVNTYANRSNLAAAFFNQIIRKYEGTRLGRQELEAEILEAMEGAMWTAELLDENRTSTNRVGSPEQVAEVEKLLPELKRVVVAIDPAATSGEESNDTGIIGAGLGYNEHGYVLADETCHEKPIGWATRAVNLLHRLQGDAIVAEINNGGEMIENTIRMVDPSVKVIVVTASRGKAKRAEPVATLDEKRRIHHVGIFPDLEEQMTNFTCNEEYGLAGSPDRMDGRTWAFYELLVKWMSGAGVLEHYRQQAAEVRERLAAATVVPAAVIVASNPVLKPLAQDPAYINRTLRGGQY